MQQLILNVQDSKLKILIDFLATLDYVEVKSTIERSDNNESSEIDATDYILNSPKNKERLDSGIKQFNEGKILERKLIEE